eukprot:2359369-Pyramimonas_sp.AAC.1
MGVDIAPHAHVLGKFTAQVPKDLIPEFIQLVGIYSCTKFVQNSAYQKTKGHMHIRYTCFRGVAQKTKASKVGEDVQRHGGKVTKCSCSASITGNYKTSTITPSSLVELTLDLRHVGHKPGTMADARLLPLLPLVKQKLDNITCLFRNHCLVRQYLDRWVRQEYLPASLPHYTQKLHDLDRRFNPSDRDIENSIVASGRKLQFSDSDQMSTFLLVSSKANWSFVLRPAQGDATAYMHQPGTPHSVHAARVNLDTRAVVTSAVQLDDAPTTSGIIKLAYITHVETAKQQKGGGRRIPATTPPSTHPPSAPAAAAHDEH